MHFEKCMKYFTSSNVRLEPLALVEEKKTTSRQSLEITVIILSVTFFSRDEYRRCNADTPNFSDHDLAALRRKHINRESFTRATLSAPRVCCRLSNIHRHYQATIITVTPPAAHLRIWNWTALLTCCSSFVRIPTATGNGKYRVLAITISVCFEKTHESREFYARKHRCSLVCVVVSKAGRDYQTTLSQYTPRCTWDLELHCTSHLLFFHTTVI